jgi:hypothetical protein
MLLGGVRLMHGGMRGDTDSKGNAKSRIIFIKGKGKLFRLVAMRPCTTTLIVRQLRTLTWEDLKPVACKTVVGALSESALFL